MQKFEKSDLIFYRCSVCGNLIIKLEDSGINPQCCGRDMELISPHDVDEMAEKHVPAWRLNGCKVMVQVGVELHPMTERHYIKWILLKTNKGIYVRKFASDDSPETHFTLNRGEEVIEIYSFCNIHGLWIAEEEETPC